MDLDWRDPNDSNIDKYQIRQQKAGGAFTKWGDISPSDGSTTAHEVTGLTNDTTYTFELRTVDGDRAEGDQEGPASSVTATPQAAAAPPAQMIGVEHTVTSVSGSSSGKVKFSWQDSGDSTITKYQYRNKCHDTQDPCDNTFTTESWTDAPASAVADDNFEINIPGSSAVVYFQLRAVGSDGDGPATGVTVNRANTNPTTPPPPVPQNLTLTATGNSLTVSWNIPGDTTNIEWQRQQNDNGGGYDDWALLTVAACSGDNTRYCWETTSVTGSWSFKVRAVNNGGTADDSDDVVGPEREVGPVTVGTPNPPTGLSVAAVMDNTNTADVKEDQTSLALTWTGPGNINAADITDYEYRMRQDGDVSWGDSVLTGSTTVAHTVTGLLAGTTYEFAARTVAGDRRSGWSDAASRATAANTEATAPDPPTGLTATAGPASAVLRWDIANDPTINGWLYLRSADGGTVFTEHRIDVEPSKAPDLTEHTVTGLSPDITYTFQLKAENTAGTSDESGSSQAKPAVLARDHSARRRVGTSVRIDLIGASNPATVTAVTQPSSGTATINAGGKSVTYTPNSDFAGTDRFDYTVTLGAVSQTATITVTVYRRKANRAPVAWSDVAETNENEPVTIDVLSNDSDADDDDLSVVLGPQSANGTVVRNADNTITYTPNHGYSGSDRFTYYASDGQDRNAAVVTVTVIAVNDAPQVEDDAAETDEDQSVVVAVLGNDSDPDDDDLTVVLVNGPRNGTATVNDDQTITYTPNADFNGTDEFSYAASDGELRAEGTVTVSVRPVEDSPVAADDVAETDEDTPVKIDVLANDNDVDGDLLMVASASGPEHGTVTINGDGTISYAPDDDFFGEDSFQYTVTDGEATTTATVTVTIHSVNDPPTATGQMSDMSLIVGGSAGSVDAAPFFQDVDGDALQFGATSTAVAGVASASVSGSTVTVSAVSEGATQITVTASDGQESATQTFSVLVKVDEQAEKQMLESVLATLGRNMLTGATSAISDRFHGSGAGGVSVAGRQMSLRDGSALTALADLAGARRGPDGQVREGVRGTELLRGSSFTLPQGAGGRLVLWGQGDVQSFEGARYEGDVTTGYVGLDVRAGDSWLAGVSVSRGSSPELCVKVRGSSSMLRLGCLGDLLRFEKREIEVTALAPDRSSPQSNGGDEAECTGSVGEGAGAPDSTLDLGVQALEAVRGA